jgi:transposase InsO family protein
MKYKFIMENRKEFRLGKMSKILEVSRSGYHNYIKRKFSQRKLENQFLLKHIKAIYTEYRGVYGSPRIHKELRKRGIFCNRKKVVRIMRVNGIRAKTKKKYKVTTNSDHNYQVAENLIKQNFNSSEVNKIWVSDITYIYTKEGWLYVCCILDLCSRIIAGWSIDTSLSSSLVIAALRQAIGRRGENPGIIFHSDRGSQYASNEVKYFLKKHKMLQSMSRKGNCYDNAVMESFFHTLKSELISFEKFQSRDEAKMKVFDYIEIFYNRQRSHSTIGYCSPVEFENNLKIKLVA